MSFIIAKYYIILCYIKNYNFKKYYKIGLHFVEGYARMFHVIEF
jgi:hypothetical protein